MNPFGSITFLDTDLATITSSDSLNMGTGSFTLELFLKRHNSGDRYIVGKRNNSSVGWFLKLVGSNLTFTVNGTTITASNAISSTSSFYHIAVECDRTSGTVSLYVDGVLAVSGSVSAGTVSCANNVSIGSTPSGESAVGSAATFSIAELRLSSVIRYGGTFDKPLFQFYDDGHTSLLFHFNEGKGSDLYDMSVNRNHGTSTTDRGSYISGPVWSNSSTIIREQIWLALDTSAALSTYASRKNLKKWRYRVTDQAPGYWNFDTVPSLSLLPDSVDDVALETPSRNRQQGVVLLEGAVHSEDRTELEYLWWLAVTAVMNQYKNSEGDLFHVGISRVQFSGPTFETDEDQYELIMFEDRIIVNYSEVR